MAKGKNYSTNYFNNKHSKKCGYQTNESKKKPLYSLEKNKCYEFAKGHAEGAIFDMTDNGAYLHVFYDRPTSHEHEQFKAGHPLEIKTLEMKDVLFMLFKFGDLPWFEAPYNVHLSPDWNDIPTSITGNSGFALVIHLFDTTDGKLVHNRLYTIPHDTSVEILKAVQHQQKMEYSDAHYDQHMREVCFKYTTDELVEMASASNTSDTEEECIAIPHFDLDNGTVSQVAKDCEVVISMLRDKNTTLSDCTFIFSGFCFEVRNHNLYLNNKRVTGKYFNGVLEGLSTQYNQSKLFASLGLDIPTINPDFLGL